MCTGLGYLWLGLISSEWWKRGKKNAQHIVRYPVNTYIWTYAPPSLLHLAHLSLPCFHYIQAHQEYHADQPHQIVLESHFDHQSAINHHHPILFRWRRRRIYEHHLLVLLCCHIDHDHLFLQLDQRCRVFLMDLLDHDHLEHLENLVGLEKRKEMCRFICYKTRLFFIDWRKEKGQCNAYPLYP